MTFALEKGLILFPGIWFVENRNNFKVILQLKSEKNPEGTKPYIRFR